MHASAYRSPSENISTGRRMLIAEPREVYRPELLALWAGRWHHLRPHPSPWPHMHRPKAKRRRRDQQHRDAADRLRLISPASQFNLTAISVLRVLGCGAAAVRMHRAQKSATRDSVDNSNSQA